MLSDMIKRLPCEACGEGELYYSQVETTNAWSHPDVFIFDNVDKIVDGIMNDVLVFNCTKCDAKIRYTFKEIEKKFRQKLTNRILTMIAMGDMPIPGSTREHGRVVIYCGKCSGYDGKGSCPSRIYDHCELKRLPRGIQLY